MPIRLRNLPVLPVLLVGIIAIQQAFLFSLSRSIPAPPEPTAALEPEPASPLESPAFVRDPIDRAEALDFIREAQWTSYPALRPPSDALIKHALRYGGPDAEPLSWMQEATAQRNANAHIEAAHAIIDGVARDRTYLSYIIQEIDAVAYDLALTLVRSGERETARNLISACAVASGDPIAYLRHTLNRMPDEDIARLWREDPYAVLVDFGEDDTLFQIRKMTDFQNRESLRWTNDPDESLRGAASVRIAAGEPNRDGALMLGWRDPLMRLSPGAAGLRVYAKAEHPDPVQVAVLGSGAFGNGREFASVFRIPLPDHRGDGWLCFDTEAVSDDLFSAVINGYGASEPWSMQHLQQGAVTQARASLRLIGLDIPPNGANRYWLDRVELYIPAGSWTEPPTVPDLSSFGLGWRPSEHDLLADDGMDDATQEQLAELEALGYLGAVNAAPATSGVTVHDTTKAWPGLNLYVSGHAPELTLMDMDGRILHTWRPNYDHPNWPEDHAPEEEMADRHWRRGRLFPNGDVLTVQSGELLVKMDRHGDILWAKPGGYHHDLRVMDDGRIYVLYREWERVANGGPGRETLVDYIMILDADGNELRRVSLLQALEDSPYAPVLADLDYGGDILHANSIQVLDGQLSDRIPAFREGNVMVCMLMPSLVAVVDMETERVVWGQTGKWLHPHDPKLLPDDTLMIFDNAGPSWHWLLPRASRVLICDPVTLEVTWDYTGGPDQPFHSNTSGAAWRLPNDNILISETNNGRAFEVTRDKEIVWEYFNPERSGENDELIANIFELVRYPEDYAQTWLQ